METIATKYEIRFYRGDQLDAKCRINETEERARKYAAAEMKRRDLCDRFELELVLRVRKIVEYDRDAGIGAP